jgi:hypothetical protein
MDTASTTFGERSEVLYKESRWAVASEVFDLKRQGGESQIRSRVSRSLGRIGERTSRMSL